MKYVVEYRHVIFCCNNKIGERKCTIFQLVITN